MSESAREEHATAFEPSSYAMRQSVIPALFARAARALARRVLLFQSHPARNQSPELLEIVTVAADILRGQRDNADGVEAGDIDRGRRLRSSTVPRSSRGRVGT